ncbi:type II toxin-antitoxin system HicB family antitoxin [Acetobacterium sp.]|jgi:predicted RNase H-like HicB family nuclease|uniref:type II toxin-antitoxin system HicB family antitoxin n=1 Tax=Acetobacterium sp. TaxID=1872094 RepID=UPI0035944EB8
MKKLVYPAILYPFEVGEGYTVEVPDLPGCISQGDSLAEAIEMGIDAASGWILDELEDGNELIKASTIEKIVPDEGGFVQYLVLDMDTYTEKHGNKAVRKNLTIPSWLNTLAEKQNINFSEVLKDALADKLHIA